jgi:hypothetical protein
MIGYGTSQCAVYDWLKEHPNSRTPMVAKAFGKPTKWAYKILSSLEDAYRIAASIREKDYPMHWWVLEKQEPHP